MGGGTKAPAAYSMNLMEQYVKDLKNQLVEVRYTGYALGEAGQLTGWRDTTQTTRQEAEVAEGVVSGSWTLYLGIWKL